MKRLEMLDYVDLCYRLFMAMGRKDTYRLIPEVEQLRDLCDDIETAIEHERRPYPLHPDDKYKTNKGTQ